MSKNNLTCMICYAPNIACETTNFNYLCFDDKVHLRFRDFNSEMIISGFEKKLGYLLSYLMNYSYLPSVLNIYDKETLIETFLKSNDVINIYNSISKNIFNNKFKGIQLKLNYRKGPCEGFGAVTSSCFPRRVVDGVEQVGNLSTFLSAFNISLDSYLFDDRYTVLIVENKSKNPNKKFINKEIKRQERAVIHFDVAQLW